MLLCQRMEYDYVIQTIQKFRPEMLVKRPHDRVGEHVPRAEAGDRPVSQPLVERGLRERGLDASAVIPIHFFVDPEQRVRCVRMGSVSEPEYAAVEKVLVPMYDGKRAEMQELLIDFDPFLFRGKVEGGLVRLSPQSLVNVAAGGGEAALAVIEPDHD